MEKREKKPYTLDRIFRILLTVFFIVIAVLLIKRLYDVLLPFFIAALLAYFIYPLTKFFQIKLKLKNRIISVILSLLLVFGIIFIAGYFFIPTIIAESQKSFIIIQNFIKNADYSTISPKFYKILNDLFSQLDASELLKNKDIQNLLKESFPHIGDALAGAGNFIINILVTFMVILYMVLILKDYENIGNTWKGLIPKKYKPITLQISKDLEEGMNKYFRGQFLIAFLVGILFAIGFTIINFPMGILFGLFIGILNIVPYLQLISLVPGIFLCVIKAAEYNENFFMVLLSMAIVYIVVQAIQDLILTPKIMGNATGLNPAIILLSLSIWGSLLGIIGMIIALPMTTIIISYYKRYIINKDKFIKEVEDEEGATDGKDTL